MQLTFKDSIIGQSLVELVRPKMYVDLSSMEWLKNVKHKAKKNPVQRQAKKALDVIDSP